MDSKFANIETPTPINVAVRADNLINRLLLEKWIHDRILNIDASAIFVLHQSQYSKCKLSSVVSMFVYFVFFFSVVEFGLGHLGQSLMLQGSSEKKL